MGKKLLFVYNAKSGKLNNLFDVAHKIISPTTYSCKLCSLTHGVFSETKEWESFKKTSSLQMEFFYIDEFLKQFKEHEEIQEISFPVVLSYGITHGIHELFSSKRIQSFSDVAALIGELKQL